MWLQMPPAKERNNVQYVERLGNTFLTIILVHASQL